MASTAQRKWNQGQEQLAGKLENTQKKTFTKWVNSQLAKGGSNWKVVNIFEDLKDGLILLNLVKIFTDAELPHNFGTRSQQRPQMIANVEQVLSYLEPLVGELTGVTAPLIVDGDHSVTLGLVWRLILHFQVAYKMDEAKKTDKPQLELKKWAKDITEPYGIEVHNFTSSWSDGRAFCALAHCHWPHLLDYKTEVEAKRPQRNLELAFAVFEQNGLEGLLEPEDFVDKPDEKSVVLYVSSIRKHIVEKAHEPPESLSLPAETVTEHVEKQVSEPKSPTASSEQLHSSTFTDGAYSMSWTSGAKNSDSTPKNGEELVTWATEEVEALKPFQLDNTLDKVKEQKQQCEALLSAMVQRGKVIFTVEVVQAQKTEVVQEQEPTDSQRPRRRPKPRYQTTIDRSLAHVSQQQATSLDELKKRISYMERSARHMHQVPPVNTEDVNVKSDVEVKIDVTARWDCLVLDLEGWKRLLDSCIAAWNKSISTEDKLRKIEEQHAKWGAPAENRDILDQFHALKTFQTSRVVPFKSEVSAMTESVAQLRSLGGHPPVDDLCRSVSERYNWLVSTVDTKCTATQECCQVVQEYEQGGFTERDCLELYQKAVTENPTINLHVAKAMTVGSPRVGKTWLRYLLLGLPPPTVSVSTPVIKTAETVGILPAHEQLNSEMKEQASLEEEKDLAQRCSERGCVNTDLVHLTSEGDKDKWVLVNEASGLQSILSYLTKYIDSHSSAKLSSELTPEVTNSTEVTSDKQSPDTQVAPIQRMLTVESRVPNMQITPQEIAPITPPITAEAVPQDDNAIARQLFHLLQNPTLQEFPILDAKLLQFLDCGGQLAYHDILPLFTTIPSIYLHVFNLTDDLTSFPEDRIQNDGDLGELYSKAISPVTTAQMITRSLMTIKSLAAKRGNLPVDILQSEPSEPCVMLVGTHLDEVEKMCKGETQAEKKLREVNKTLWKSLKSDVHDLEAMILKNSRPPLPSMFFPVSNRFYTEVSDGQQSEICACAISCLRKRIKDQISSVKVKIPVKWYVYQLLEMDQSREGSKLVYRYSELYQSCCKERVVVDVGEFHTMVMYFTALGLFVHLCGEDVKHTEESTCFIFTNPTYLSEIISKLYQVQFLDEDRCEGGLLNLKRRGLLTEKTLQDLQIDEAHLTHRELMDLLVQLSIGAECTAGNGDKGMAIFIPSVLMQPADSSAVSSKLQETKPHFVLTFKELSFIPCGVFAGAITRLLKKDWEISKSKKEESLSRIHIPFAIGGHDNVSLFDCATHIRVVMTVSKCEQKAQMYRDCVLGAIAESYCFLFHCKAGMDHRSTPCKECHSNPFLLLGLTCRTCKSEVNHIAMLHLDDDGKPETVRCQETHDAEDLSDKQSLLFQNMKHYAVVPKQHTCVAPMRKDPLMQETPATQESKLHSVSGAECVPFKVCPSELATDDAGPMKKWNIDALLSLQGDLKLNVKMSTGLNDMLVRAAHGFMNRTEVQAVTNKQNDSDKMEALIQILLGKRNADFNIFCTMLRNSNNGVWANQLEHKAREFRCPEPEAPQPASADLLAPKVHDTPTASPSVDTLRSEFLSSKPTAVLLLRKVVPKVAHEWLQIGVCLEMEVAILKTFKATESHDLKLCCLEMFETWLKESVGTGESPRTWSSVLSAVGDCLGQDIADNIEGALLEGRR